MFVWLFACLSEFLWVLFCLLCLFGFGCMVSGCWVEWWVCVVGFGRFSLCVDGFVFVLLLIVCICCNFVLMFCVVLL